MAMVLRRRGDIINQTTPLGTHYYYDYYDYSPTENARERTKCGHRKRNLSQRSAHCVISNDDSSDINCLVLHRQKLTAQTYSQGPCCDIDAMTVYIYM